MTFYEAMLLILLAVNAGMLWGNLWHNRRMKKDRDAHEVRVKDMVEEWRKEDNA